MIAVRKSEERGHTDIGWLDSRHTFSFGDYHDPAHMGFGPLRVINEDKVAPGAGFPAHPHHNMEILTVVLSGSLEHRDSLGNGSTLHPGEVQCMTAGTGIRHSEMNPDRARPVHFVQIWVLPEQKGLTPSYAQRAFTARRRPGEITLVASRDGRDESLRLNQDVDLYVGDVMPNMPTTLALRPGRAAWLQVTRGSVSANGHTLASGDAAAFTEEQKLELYGDAPAEVLVFDVPWHSNA
ncbi:pirin family protein [Nibricoccus sp. IMCC34717]|uniref:pirin family protein n=1 Tax=Nibricoccus sp. IMCC34717 TaxID=3034021 RepID=UPI00384B5968